MNKENYLENNEEVFMDMSPWDFDQSPDGWRKYEKTQGSTATAELIKKYIGRNLEKTVDPKQPLRLEVLYFHIGQLLAMEGQGHFAEAIDALKNSSYSEGRECWNAYVSATIGFLDGNIKKIEVAIKTVLPNPIVKAKM